MQDRTDAPIPYVPPHEHDDEPMDGDWITCWRCGGEGGEEGDDPFWDLGEWIRCDICRGEGGWVCGPVEAADGAR